MTNDSINELFTKYLEEQINDQIKMDVATETTTSFHNNFYYGVKDNSEAADMDVTVKFLTGTILNNFVKQPVQVLCECKSSLYVELNEVIKRRLTILTESTIELNGYKVKQFYGLPTILSTFKRKGIEDITTFTFSCNLEYVNGGALVMANELAIYINNTLLDNAFIINKSALFNMLTAKNLKPNSTNENELSEESSLIIGFGNSFNLDIYVPNEELYLNLIKEPKMAKTYAFKIKLLNEVYFETTYARTSVCLNAVGGGYLTAKIAFEKVDDANG